MANTNPTRENFEPKKNVAPPEELLIEEDKTEYPIQVVAPRTPEEEIPTSNDDPVEGSVETIEAAEEHEEEELRKQKRNSLH